MGRARGSTTRALVLDSDGRVAFDAVAKGGTANRFTAPRDLVGSEGAGGERPDEEAEAAVEAKTKQAMSARLAGKGGTAPGPAKARQEGEFIRFTPTSGDGEGKARIVKMVERQEDPLEPAKHKHRRVPKVMAAACWFRRGI